MSPEPVYIFVFTEGEFNSIESRPTYEQALSYCFGFTDGAMAYGAGSAGAFVYPNELEDMKESVGEEALNRALQKLDALKASQSAK